MGMFSHWQWRKVRLPVLVKRVRAPGAALVFAAMLGLHTSASPWGAEGHRLIADIAAARLTASARTEVDRLLALEPGATLASISTWADEVRSPSTAPWHYVNLPRDADCRYEPDRSCVQGSCVVGAIERQVAVLVSAGSDEERLKALKYVVHFVADVHQPLHAGFADDRGGNTYQLQAYGRGTNLHALWDSGLVQNWPGGSMALRQALESGEGPRDVSFAPRDWAEASCRLVSAAGFYPDGHRLDDEYAKRLGSTLVEQMTAAARRLAAVLNKSLDKR